MRTHEPDGWTILKVGSDYRIFGSWSGGFADPDKYRINSGVSHWKEEDDYLLFYGYTGSVYKCHKSSEGRLTAYNGLVLEDFLSQDGVERISFEQFKKEFVGGIDDE